MLNWIVIGDWAYRAFLCLLMLVSALLMPLWARSEFKRPDSKNRLVRALDWACEVIIVGFKLALCVFLVLFSVFISMHKTIWRLKKEGVIQPCPICGQDYTPKK
jgi:hypothetical protein